jgi:predicted lipid carrier protein YhbT
LIRINAPLFSKNILLIPRKPSLTMLQFPRSLKPVARLLAGLPGRYIPYSAQKPVLWLALNDAFRVPLAHGELDFLDGRNIRIRVHDLSIDWLLSLRDGRFRPLDRALDADVCISGDGLDFALLATRQADPDTLFFQRRIRIEGDTDLGLAVKNTMDAMDWDDLPLPLRRMIEVLAMFLAPLVRGDLESGKADDQ